METTIKRLPLDEAARIGRETQAEMLGRGGCKPNDEAVRMIETLCHHAETIDDKSLAGGCLILGGVLCAALALVIGLCGAIYAGTGKLAVSQQMEHYLLGFALFAVVQFAVVRLTKRRG